MLLREHRFKFFARTEEFVFRVDELVDGIAAWPGRFRLQLPASPHTEAKTFYGASCEEVAGMAADFVASCSGHLGKIQPRTCRRFRNLPLVSTPGLCYFKPPKTIESNHIYGGRSVLSGKSIESNGQAAKSPWSASPKYYDSYITVNYIYCLDNNAR